MSNQRYIASGLAALAWPEVTQGQTMINIAESMPELRQKTWSVP